ncbi:GNAT family N-acetyltransferase [Halalkalibacillus halophilus]|uniref:GNAT family N-acetyltransferase n=1 Tax=Halalkalibacillus halophilus TaxID=392827 RepID=UPI0003F5B4AF|nr:GNAT family N-acetyltransferase [Halalkalibacillus halophilus]
MITIREARKEDAAQIVSVYDQTWQATYEPLLKEDDLQEVTSTEHRKIMWETVLQSSTHRVYVVDSEESGVVGFLSGGKERTENFNFDCEIYDIYIHPNHQRNGYGKMLVEAFVKDCYTNGNQSLLVWILTDNPFGDFYVRLGASVVEAENVTIGKGTYQETAYGWTSIEVLIDRLKLSEQC